MSELKATPGPYTAVKIAEGLFHIHSPKGERQNPVPVAVVDHHRDGHKPTRTITTPANAHLLAASWELYEALEDALEFMEKVEDKTLVGHEGCLWTPEIARAALSKARGE